MNPLEALRSLKRPKRPSLSKPSFSRPSLTKQPSPSMPPLWLAAAAIAVLAWIGWAIYVGVTSGIDEAIGVLVAWPTLVAAVALVAGLFFGIWMLGTRAVHALARGEGDSDEKADEAGDAEEAGDTEQEDTEAGGEGEDEAEGSEEEAEAEEPAGA